MGKLIIIYGPTASGKTNLALQLGKLLHAPILNMDSKQIYYSLSELTASPSKDEQKNIPHYFFNDKNPSYQSNVDSWCEDINNILSSGIHENYILVGGSGFYLKYFLTPTLHTQETIFYNQLVSLYLQNFSWHNIIKIFSLYEENRMVSRIIPHDNDKFRQFNYLKSYFQRKFSIANILDFNGNINYSNDYFNSSSPTLKITLIIINPDLSQLQENIILRTPCLLSQATMEEARFIHNHIDYGKNFNTIIGFKEINDLNFTKEEILEKIKLKTMNYAKQQKKWIGQFTNYNPILLKDSNYNKNFNLLNPLILNDYI